MKQAAGWIFVTSYYNFNKVSNNKYIKYKKFLYKEFWGVILVSELKKTLESLAAVRRNRCYYLSFKIETTKIRRKKMVLYTLSIIWKNGGVFNIMENGEIELDLSNAKEIPEVVLKTAESIYDEIKSFLVSVEGMDAASKTLWKMYTTFCGWQQNDKIKDFLNGDEEALDMFLNWQAKLNGLGWEDIYEPYMAYENDSTHVLKIDIYKRAIEYFKK